MKRLLAIINEIPAVISVLLFQGLTDNPVEAAVDFFKRGYAYQQLGNYRHALSDFNRAIELNPEYFEAFIYRSIALAKLGKFEESLADSKKALELKPDNLQALMGLAFAYEKTGSIKESEKCLKRAADLGDKIARRYLYERSKAKK